MYKQRDVELLWQKYTKLLKGLKDQNVDNLIESWDQRIIMSSFSLREKEPFCGIGGLVEYSLELAKASNNIAKALNYDVAKHSIIKCCLLSILGRVGDVNEDRFKECTSEWHQEKLGQYFDWNENCPKYLVNDMTLFLLQNNNIYLTWEEWQGISLLGDLSSDNSKFYSTHKSRLSLVLQLAYESTLKDEKDKIDGVYTVPF